MKLVRLFLSAACALLTVSAAPGWTANPAVAAAPVAPKANAGLTSHKAVYDLSLIKTVGGEGVRGARGTMTYTIADRCDGYTIESNVTMTLAYSDGNTQKVEQRYAAWEAKSGRFSSFTMQTIENDKPGKSYRGTITLDQNGAGTASYEGEKTTTFDLKPGTMLSTAHTQALLDHAAEGKNFFSGAVIDGSFDQGPFVVSAAIATARNAAAALDKDGARELSGGRYWPMSLAYFPQASQAAVPEYELGMELLPTGVSRAMTQDFGAFTIGFKLTDVAPLKPDC